VQLSTTHSQVRNLFLDASSLLATHAGPVAIADDGSQRLPDASDGGTAADEPPTTDLWSLYFERNAKHGHARLITTDFWRWIIDGREYRGQEEEDSEGSYCESPE
jgi:hypothetical protein